LHVAFNKQLNLFFIKNLATSKKIFVLHGEENLEAQLALLSDDMTMNLFFNWWNKRSKKAVSKRNV